MTSVESFLTSAPITPSDVKRRYSKGRDFEVVLRKGYKNRGMCAGRKSVEIYLSSIMNGSHPAGTGLGSRCVTQHTARAQARCIHGSMQLL